MDPLGSTAAPPPPSTDRAAPKLSTGPDCRSAYFESRPAEGVAAAERRSGSIGRLRVVQAFSRAERKLGNNERVRVIDLMDDTTLLVEPLDGGARAEEG